MTFEIPKPGMPIYIDVDGRRLQLRFSLKTLKALEKDFNISVLKGDGLSVAFRDPELLTNFLWYGLKAKNPEVSREWVEDEFDASMLMDLIPLLAYAVTGNDISNALPKRGLEIVPNGKAPIPQAGLTYGLSDATTFTSQNVISGG